MIPSNLPIGVAVGGKDDTGVEGVCIVCVGCTGGCIAWTTGVINVGKLTEFMQPQAWHLKYSGAP